MEYPQITSAQTSWWMGGGWVNSFSLMMEEHNAGLNINFLCRVLVDICVPTCVSNGLRRRLCIVTLFVFQVFTDGTKTLYQRRRPPVSFFLPQRVNTIIDEIWAMLVGYAMVRPSIQGFIIFQFFLWQRVTLRCSETQFEIVFSNWLCSCFERSASGLKPPPDGLGKLYFGR